MAKEDLFRDLQTLIAEMEHKQLEEEASLCQQFKDVINGFRLFKEIVNEVSDSRALKDHLVSLLISISSGYLSKRIIKSKSKNIYKIILGNIALFGIYNLLSKHKEKSKIE